MIRFLTTATLNWFDDGCCDVRYLDLWENAPVTYVPGQAIDANWHVDHHEELLAVDHNGKIFRYAADLLMRYQFYPPDLISHTSDFSLENRWLQVGDRVVQRIHIFSLFGRPVLDIVGITEISHVIASPRRYGFTYITVAPHAEQGEWSARLDWYETGQLVLTIHAISSPSEQEPARNHAFMRSLQQKAHQRGIAHFKQALRRRFPIISTANDQQPAVDRPHR